MQIKIKAKGIKKNQDKNELEKRKREENWPKK